MKAKSTIQKQIRALKAISDDPKQTTVIRDQAYEAYHALRWVIEKTTWTPASLLGEQS